MHAHYRSPSFATYLERVLLGLPTDGDLMPALPGSDLDHQPGSTPERRGDTVTSTQPTPVPSAHRWERID